VGKTLSIPNWGDRFETAQSRKVGRVTWTPFPHSFASSMRMQDPEVAAAMLQIVILAASMPKRGVFHDGGRDLSTEDIERYVGASSEVVARAMSALGVYRKKERERRDCALLWPGELSEIAAAAGDPEASVSAQLRHLRKPRFGSYVVEKRPRGDRSAGLFEYRVSRPRPPEPRQATFA